MSSSYPPPPPPEYGQGGYGAPPAAPRNGLGLTALILGIVGILLSWTVVGGILLGIAAIVLGVIGRKRARRGEATNGGVALGGIITGAIALVLGVVMIALSAWFVSQLGFGDLARCLQEAQGDPVAEQQCQVQYEGELNERLGS
ncbi:hypothetical protein NUM3379_27350 [Kineococcus sp. NUM-3379]